MRFAVAVLPCLLFALATGAQSPYRARATIARTAATPPVIDGDLGDEAWKAAEPLAPFIDPYTGKPPADGTEAFLLYDRAAIYVAFRCHDSDPGAITAREIRRGASLGTDDCVILQLDPFHRRSGMGSYFAVNPVGTQEEQVDGGHAAKQEWIGNWTAAARKLPDGWSAEMRIPWSMLTYPSGARIDMDLNLIRSQARTHVNSQWSDAGPNGRPENVGSWVGVSPPPRQERRAWQAMGYVVGAASEGDDASIRAGLDLRTDPSPRLSGLLSINPDFRNVEQSVDSIAFSRREVYLRDARPFFAEGGDYLATPLFYSRRIGQIDAGAGVHANPTPRTTVAAMHVRQGGSDHASVAAAQYSLSRGSFLRAAAVEARGWGMDTDGVEGEAYIRTGTWRLLGDFLHSRSLSNSGGSALAAAAYTAPHWWCDLHWEQVDPGFRTGLGVQDFVDRRGPLVSTSYNNQYRTGPVRGIMVNTTHYRFNHMDGRAYQEVHYVTANLETRGDHSLYALVQSSRFDGARDDYGALYLSGDVSNRLRSWQVGYEFGTRADQRYRYLSAGIQRRLPGRIDAAISTAVLALSGSREQVVVTVGREFDPRRALNARLVRQDGRTNGYLAYRNAGGVGQDLYVIVGDPNAREWTGALAVKWVWAM